MCFCMVKSNKKTFSEFEEVKRMPISYKRLARQTLDKDLCIDRFISLKEPLKLILR